MRISSVTAAAAAGQIVKVSMPGWRHGIEPQRRTGECAHSDQLEASQSDDLSAGTTVARWESHPPEIRAFFMAYE